MAQQLQEKTKLGIVKNTIRKLSESVFNSPIH